VAVDTVCRVLFTEFRKVHVETLNETVRPASVSTLPSRQTSPLAHLKKK
jgi:hypothetical protein